MHVRNPKTTWQLFWDQPDSFMTMLVEYLGSGLWDEKGGFCVGKQSDHIGIQELLPSLRSTTG
jgi:hypothetical protein